MARLKKKINKEESIENQLWKAADKLRKNIDAAEYKHIVLGLIFLKYISDAFEELHEKLKNQKGEYAGADPEDKDEYKAENVFFVPPSARWAFLKSHAKHPTIGKTVDDALDAIERENVPLRSVLPKVYAKDNLDPTNLGGLIDLISNIGLGGKKETGHDVLGRIFEFFLGRFALAEGKKGGQFYTPRNVVELLVTILEPFSGRILDPCCGSGGMFIQSERFVQEHQGKMNDISIYGQESNQTTWRLAKMNLAIRSIDSTQVKWNNEGSFLNDSHKDLKADYVIANPPFNDSDWSGELLRKDGRWKYGVPPASNANFAWMQHFLYHLNPTNGIAGIVMHCSAASNKGKVESGIRKNLINANIVDCIIALPTQLFYNTTLPVHIWILNRAKKNKSILMIDAYDVGRMVESTLRELLKEDIERIAEKYHGWKSAENYEDELGFCYAASEDDVKERGYILAPNRYVQKRKRTRKRPYEEELKPVIANLSSKVNEISKAVEFNDLSSAGFKKQHFINTKHQDKIQKGWKEIELREVITDVITGTWGNAEPKKGNVPIKVIRGTDLPNIALFNLHKTPTRYIGKDKVTNIAVNPNDLVIEMSGGSKDQPTGRVGFITEELLAYLKLPTACSNFCKILRVNKDVVEPIWFYLYWQNAYVAGLTTRYENQPSGIKNFQLEEFMESELIWLPPKSLQKKYSLYMRNLFNLRNKMAFSSANLNALISHSFDNVYTDYDE